MEKKLVDTGKKPATDAYISPEERQQNINELKLIPKS